MEYMSLPMPEPQDEDFQWDFDFDSQDSLDFAFMLPAETPLEEQLLLDTLLDQGFTWDESLRLLLLRANRYAIAEVVEHVTEDPTVKFTRWLYQHHLLES